MIDQTTLIAYLAILLGFVFIPGPAVLLTLTRASTSGTSVGIATGLGIAIGDLLHTAMVVFGLSAVILNSALVFSLIKYAGAAYLIYLGIRSFFRKANFRSGPFFKSNHRFSSYAASCFGGIAKSQISIIFSGVSAPICSSRKWSCNPSTDRFKHTICRNGSLEHYNCVD